MCPVEKRRSIVAPLLAEWSVSVLGAANPELRHRSFVPYNRHAQPVLEGSSGTGGKIR